MEWLASAWATIEPYAVKFLDLIINSGIGALIGLLVVKKWEKKHDENSLTNKISENVSKNIIGKNVLVSLEAANKEQINNILSVIQNQLKKDFEIVKEQANIVSSMAKIMLRFKAATEEEKQQLLASINNLEKVNNVELTIIEDAKPVVVEVSKIEESETQAEDISLF